MFKYKIPIILICARIGIAIMILLLAFQQLENTGLVIAWLMTIGLITDVLDGMVARYLKMNTEKLRVWDSGADQFFWLITIGAIFYLNRGFILQNYLPILMVFALEALAYLISYLRFKKPIATHSLLAKFWTLTLFAFLLELTLRGSSSWIFVTCIVLGAISRLEIILIISRLNTWASDVPSLFSVKA